MALIQHKTEIGNVVIDDVTGVSYFTQSSLAAACGCDPVYIRDALKSVQITGRESPYLTAEVLTTTGLKTGKIYPAGDVWTLQFILSKSPELALRMLQVGSNIYVHNLAGFAVKSDAATEFHQTVAFAFEQYRERMRGYDREINRISPKAYDLLCQGYFGMTVAEYKERFGEDFNTPGLFLPDTAPESTWRVHLCLRSALASTKRRDTLQATVDYAIKKAKKEIAKLG